MNLGKAVGEAAARVGMLSGVREESPGRSTLSPSSPEREHLLNKYDRAFEQLLSRRRSNLPSETLEKMRGLLFELSPDIKSWREDAKMRIFKLMQEIQRDLDDPSGADAGLALLQLVLSIGGDRALEMARPLFSEKIQKMYLDQRYENSPFVPRLLLMFEDYDPARVESLTKEAIHLWPESRFSAARDHLGLEHLVHRGTRAKVRGILRSEIAKAGMARDRTALNRAVDLYHIV